MPSLYEIMVFDSESEKEAKRVIGMPNDEVRVDDFVYINGIKYMNSRCLSNICRKVKYVLNTNEYFVIGDNYFNSLDSRWFGPINNNQILGIKIW